MFDLASDNLQPAYLKTAEDFRSNPGQWKAYESTGNCVVLAGPGSGKTKLLTTKMARIIHEDIRPPQGIACITYSTECARELKKRLDALGISEKRNIFIGTVHSFCLNHIVRPYATIAGLSIPNPIAVVDNITWNNIFAKCYREIGYWYSSQLRTNFDKYRRTHLDHAAQSFFEDPKMAALVNLFEAELRAAGFIDFDDMALIGLKLIKNNYWIQKTLKARFPVLIIDEYQDLGEALHQIVLQLTFSANVRIFAVGDPDQSIYGFSGAKPQLLKELSDYENVEKVELGFNYRCAQKIVANSIVALGEHREYQSASKDEGKFYLWECPEGIEEQADAVCKRIIPTLLVESSMKDKARRNLGDIAVLYLDKFDAAKITSAVKNQGYSYVGGDRDASYKQSSTTRWIEDCAAWCSGGWQNGHPRLSQIIHFWLNVHESSGSSFSQKDTQQTIVNFLWQNRTLEKSFSEWLNGLLSLGLLEKLSQSQVRTDEVESLLALIENSKDSEKLAQYTVQAFGNLRGSPKHLNLVTLHSSKGLEFDVVIIIGLEQGRIPNFNAKTEKDIKEERRKFYVGLTRAKREVHLLYSGWYMNSYGRKFENGPSEFVLEQMNINK